METKQQAHIPAIRAENKRQEDERQRLTAEAATRLTAEAATRRMVREQDQRAARTPYGNTSSYTPASDGCSAPFVPAAENYTPAPTDATPSRET